MEIAKERRLNETDKDDMTLFGCVRAIENSRFSFINPKWGKIPIDGIVLLPEESTAKPKLLFLA